MADKTEANISKALVRVDGLHMKIAQLDDPEERELLTVSTIITITLARFFAYLFFICWVYHSDYSLKLRPGGSYSTLNLEILAQK